MLARVRDSFRIARERLGMRLVHFSIQSNHVHALVEAEDEHALSRALKGLGVRLARGLNRLWETRGRRIADRYHARVLRTPREVRYALAYVLLNARKHGVRAIGVDEFSSGTAFDGWRELRSVASAARAAFAGVIVPRTWLLAIGWRRHGLISIAETPGSPGRAPP